MTEGGVCLTSADLFLGRAEGSGRSSSLNVMGYPAARLPANPSSSDSNVCSHRFTVTSAG